ncbi:MAG: enoyl-CoA hydratase/isomerase family protein [Deltaproteobacteria bacterium]|nr:enoyl-CoA hydratase/isomerase family protein [Deltaproteobacteria bacterium]
MQKETLSYEVRDRVGVVTMTRPKQLNAMSSRFFAEMNQVLDEAEAADVGALVLTGQGKAFCAGADVAEVQTMNTIAAMTTFTNRTHELFVRMESFDKPILGAINGIALGGGFELALACDMRIASSEAKLGLPEAKIGLVPGAGGCTRLPKMVGIGKALEILILGEPITAREAHALGVVNWVVEPDQLESEALRIAGVMARERPPLSIAAIKRVTRSAANSDTRSGLAVEMFAALALSFTADKQEGMKALAERRPPAFKGA